MALWERDDPLGPRTGTPEVAWSLAVAVSFSSGEEVAAGAIPL